MNKDAKQLTIINDKILNLMNMVWDLSHTTKNEIVCEHTAKAWITLSDMHHNFFDVAWDIKNPRKR